MRWRRIWRIWSAWGNFSISFLWIHKPWIHKRWIHKPRLIKSFPYHHCLMLASLDSTQKTSCTRQHLFALTTHNTHIRTPCPCTHSWQEKNNTICSDDGVSKSSSNVSSCNDRSRCLASFWNFFRETTYNQVFEKTCRCYFKMRAFRINVGVLDWE